MEHITTMDAVNFVESCKEGFVTILFSFLVFWFLLICIAHNILLIIGSVGATVTPQHLLLNRNALFQGGLQPHNYCLPVLKREIHSMFFTFLLNINISFFQQLSEDHCFYFIVQEKPLSKL